jgi:golgi-specific brefeldin A-resistance guanine nucleotide exchange factor 1
MSSDAQPLSDIGQLPAAQLPSSVQPSPRMQYRSRPVSVAVDPVSLVISECISITSTIQKHARSPHSSVSAILGGNPNPIQLGPPSPALRGSRSPSLESPQDVGAANRWGLRGKKGKSIQDNPLMASFGKLRHELATIKGWQFHPEPFMSAAH